MRKFTKPIALMQLFFLFTMAAFAATTQGRRPESQSHRQRVARPAPSSGMTLTETSLSTGDPRARLKQFPTISRTHVAFIYANDLWCAPREGGVAVPLTDAPGMKNNALFSPDGKTIAFGGNLEGDFEIYTVPIEQGAPPISM
jgi:WD40 repeat protein